MPIFLNKNILQYSNQKINNSLKTNKKNSNSFIYLFMVVLGFRCCTRTFSICGERGLLFVAVCGLLIAVVSLCCRARALGARASVVVAHRLSSCSSQALEHRLSTCGTRVVAPWHVGSSRTRAHTRVPYIGRRILNHCTTREVP